MMHLAIGWTDLQLGELSVNTAEQDLLACFLRTRVRLWGVTRIFKHGIAGARYKKMLSFLRWISFDKRKRKNCTVLVYGV
jgi:hypothetical protein